MPWFECELPITGSNIGIVSLQVLTNWGGCETFRTWVFTGGSELSGQAL